MINSMSPPNILFIIYEATGVSTQEDKYIESWPNTSSAWAGWRSFDIPVDRSDGVNSLLHCTS
jgi:hypothetical protein